MRSMPRPKLKLLPALSFLWLLTACASTGPGTPTSGTSGNPVCLATAPLTFSKDDTAATKDEIRRLNAVLRALCPQFAPAPPG